MQVLVAMGGSYLEKEVLKIVQDSLLSQNMTVKVVDLDAIKYEDPNQYQATLIFGAIEAKHLREPVPGYVSSLNKGKSRIMVSTIYGEPWSKNNSSVDAVTAATASLQPEKVAANILTHLFPKVKTGK